MTVSTYILLVLFSFHVTITLLHVCKYFSSDATITIPHSRRYRVVIYGVASVPSKSLK